MIIEVLNTLLLSMLVVTALGIARMRSLFPVAMMTGLFSLLSASLFVLLDAVDVALTEAAVGAGIITVLFLGTFALTSAKEKTVLPRRALLGLGVVCVTGAILVYASLDMPHFGASDTPVHNHPMRERFIETSQAEVGVPNMVTAVLASYRGYDTLGEVCVIFTAGLGVVMLLGARKKAAR